MVGLAEALFLGAVQGLTEWLPISSSGHLVIIQELFGIQVPLLFDVMLHFGTVLALFAFFRKEIWRGFQALLRWDRYAGGKRLVYIAVGTIPVAVLGFFLHDLIAQSFQNIQDVAILMVFMGFILSNTRDSKGKRKLDLEKATYIGVAQAAALAPGISRSGITISAALSRGVRKEQAFIFSFMLAIPAIIGASVFELYNANIIGYVITPEMWVGTAMAAAVGYIALMILKDTLLKGKFYRFGHYCWIVGFSVLIYSFL